MKLYGFWRSTATWRVRIALAYKGLDHTYEPVDLGAGAQHDPGYHGLNPMEQVPTLVLDGGERLTQSIAILEFLEERHPAPPLLPADPLARARVRQLVEVVNSGIQPLQNRGIQQRLAQIPGADVKAWLEHFVGRGLSAFEQLARPIAGRFCVGDLLSFADLVLVPQLHFARRNGLAVDAYPTLLRVESACESLECFRLAHADRQPDAPANATTA